MTFIKIAIGLFGLGIVVFIHELGHFLAARFCKIGVEAFSIGWGNPLIKKKVGDVEYRLGAFPVGGYCKFKGASDHGTNEYKEAYDLYNEGKKLEVGSFLAATPAARMLTCFAGPFFNLLLAAFFLAIIWGVGFEYPDFDNRIALASERIEQEETEEPIIYPADIAGLKTGDRVIEANGKQIFHYSELRKIILTNPNKELNLIVEREGKTHQLIQITPALNKEFGSGQIGILPFSDNYQIVRSPKYNFFTAIGKGFTECWETLVLTIQSFKVLFMGIDLTKAVSGPVRITYMMGDIAAQGMGQGLWVGVRSFMEFVSLISVALCIMNLLPLPIIDGGMIILFFVELVRGKPTHPKAISVFQGIGIAFIFTLMIFAIFGDILYFIRQ